MKKAIEGIRVIDLSHVLAAPTATMFLSDLGGTCLRCPTPSAGVTVRQGVPT
jgi:crotonobetainyl-CoA:carnitine CoA-transferase CaiB-like acyl-CoA transferase